MGVCLSICLTVSRRHVGCSFGVSIRPALALFIAAGRRSDDALLLLLPAAAPRDLAAVCMQQCAGQETQRHQRRVYLSVFLLFFLFFLLRKGIYHFVEPDKLIATPSSDRPNRMLRLNQPNLSISLPTIKKCNVSSVLLFYILQ